ncbi:response regulator [Runella slithyformis]|uniref:Two component transcriptional regulator, LuxR family n=1 Tax=Runella slithyformis (strain ATCC 29530 / DSM 19594 / LMG 11500 / NCIMB 11436 / LSU 4) TaxID=761193 RepID=A0A7U4E8M1_RUNSL|nr:response regulator transcription factor [Runella slithyformis]AEI51493.1 two component transcriptional regulator, LuxR family [Runella slithyformis DSM 19594]
MINVGLVEDNLLLAQGIKEKLALSDDLTLNFHVHDGKALFDYLEPDNLPEIILMDIEMDTMDGITATRELKRRFPTIKVLMITVLDDDDKLFEAFKAGASGYLLKDVKPARLINAISETLDGGIPMSPTIASKALDLLLQNDTSKQKNVTAQLSPRENDVLDLLVKGMSVRQISDTLFVSEKTVRKHLEHIYQKLQVKGSREAIAKFVKRLVK